MQKHHFIIAQHSHRPIQNPVDGSKLLTVFATSSILDVWEDSEYAFDSKRNAANETVLGKSSSTQDMSKN